MHQLNKFTLALAQINPTVGDLAGNAARMLQMASQAADTGADLVLYPEMCLTGYPPEDLVLIPAFRAAAMEQARAIAKATRDLPCDLIFGSVWEEMGKGGMGDTMNSLCPPCIYNASLLASRGELTLMRAKHDLPNYGVFDEKRVFDVGAAPLVEEWRGVRLGILICEEVWDVAQAKALAAQGAEILLVQNASPYHIGKANERKKVVTAAATATGLPVVYLNLVGGQDELVFDGRSYAVSPDGTDVARLPAFAESLGILKWEKNVEAGSVAPSPLRGGSGRGASNAVHNLEAPPPNLPRKGGGTTEQASPTEQPVWRCTSAPMAALHSDEATIYRALVLGLRDYVTKNNFPSVVLGLSGGIDSGVTAAIAADALGAEKVHTIRLPSPFTSDDSVEDAEQLAAALGLRMDTVPITPLMDTARQTLAPMFAGRHPDTTEENIQARLRGLLLMAVSNKFGAMVLTTGNKSEMSVGYATLYGDMCGGFSVLKDVYKTTVVKLAQWRSAQRAEMLEELGFLGAGSVIPSPLRGGLGRGASSSPQPNTSPPLPNPPRKGDGATEQAAHPVIPHRMITKPPTAELRPNQRDEDSLPPYETLDLILRGLIERQCSIAELVAEGMDEATVTKVARMVANAEYKRRQSAPGVKITPMAFGRDRRWPITNRWKFA